MPMLRRRPKQSSTRSGMTLYEVVLAIAIFLMASTAISQLVSIGSRASVRAKLQTDAALHCETKLNEVIAGAVAMESLSGETFLENDPSWTWSLTVGDAEIDGLKDLTVTVAHYDNLKNKNAAFSIRRLVRDPEIFLEAAEEKAVAAEEAAAAESDPN